MSHFVTIVLADDPDDVPDLLAPYDEHIEVEAYEEECWCVGQDARHDANHNPNLVPLRNRIEEVRARLSDFNGELHDIPAMAEIGPVWARIGERVDSYIETLGESPALLAARDAEKAIAADWFAAHDALEKQHEANIAEHPRATAADPDCDECGGSGRRMSTYNPRSQWDWWQVGGRWTGMLDRDYDPEMDPRNTEVCPYCRPHPGKRYWREEETVGEPEGIDAITATENENGVKVVSRPSTADDPLAIEYTCNGCEGTGIAQKWPTQWEPFEGDVQPITNFLALLGNGTDATPFALVTPDGAWHERGRMGWFGMAADEKDRDDWYVQVQAIVAEIAERHPDAVAVVVDCHI